MNYESCEVYFSFYQSIFTNSKISRNNDSVTPKVNNIFQIQAFTQQLELLTRVTKDLKDEMALMRQQNSGMDGLRMGANQRGNII